MSHYDALYIERPAESRCSCSKLALLFTVDPVAARSQPCSIRRASICARSLVHLKLFENDSSFNALAG
jgi:hypothetical protein